VGKFRDYYEVLGCAPRSHARIIEEKYWEQAHELHKEPTKKAQRRLAVINEAYEVLGSPHRREVYDRQRSQRVESNRPPAGPGFLQTMLTLIAKPFRPD
jgi:curved DNA-binding protein CbpA